MAWGILEDRKTPRPLGTVPLESKGSSFDIELQESKHLKRNGDIVLQPQPTDSPNDPLNWPYKRKLTLLLIVAVAAYTAAGISNMLATGYAVLAKELRTDIPTIVKSLRSPSIASATIGLFLASAIAAVYGKRVQLVVASIILLFTMLAGYFADSLIFYQIVTVFIGFPSATMEVLAAPIVVDMLYVHERGTLGAILSVIGVIGGDLK